MLFRVRFKHLAAVLCLSCISLGRAVPQPDSGHTSPHASSTEAKPAASASLDKKYAQAVDLYEKEQLSEARALFEQIWFAAGSFKETRQYLDKIRAKTSKAKPDINADSDELAILPGLDLARPVQGGQTGGPVTGGLSSAERISRLLIDGRRSFDDGDLDAANSKFAEALKLDSSNPEAKKFMGEIEKSKGSAKFNPSATLAELPMRRTATEAMPLAPTPAAPANDKIFANLDQPGAVKVVNTSAVSEEDKPAAQPVSEQPKPETAKPAPPPAQKTPKIVTQQLGTVEKKKLSSKTETVFNASGETVKGSGKTSLQAFATPVVAKIKSAVVEAAKKAEEKAAAEKAELAAKPAEAAPAPAPTPAAASEEAKEIAAAEKKHHAPASSTIVRGNDSKSAADALAMESSLALPEVVAENPEAKAVPQRVEKPSEKAKPADQQKPVKAPEVKTADAAKPVDKKEETLAEPKPEPAKEVAKAVEPKAVAAKPAEQLPTSEKKEPVKSTWSVMANPVLDEKAKEQKAAGEPKKDGKPGDATVASAPQPDAAKTAEPVDLKALFAQTLKETVKATKPADIPNLPNDKITSPETKVAESARQVAGKEAREHAAGQTKEGIRLFNEGDYAQALEKFSTALASDPSYLEADEYKGKALKRLESTAGREQKVLAQAAEVKKVPDAQGNALQSLDALTAEEPKPAATDPAKPAAATTEENKPADLDKKPADAPKTEEKKETPSADPQVEADKLLRQAQRELGQGRRDEALRLAREARALDGVNVEIRSLIGELEGPVAPAGLAPRPGDALPSLATTEIVREGAPMPPPSATDEGAVGVNGLYIEAKNKFEAGQTQEALAAFQAVLEIDPKNAEAKAYIERIRSGESRQAPSRAQTTTVASSEQAEAAFQKGLVAYEAGRLDVAVQWWNYTLTLDGNNARAIEYLQSTRTEYDAWVQQHQYNAVSLQKEAVANEKLDTAVTYDTAGQKSIVEFLSAMSLITDVSFYVSDGVDPEIRVVAKFEDTPLHDALDIVLLPIGLKWSRTQDVVTITPDLRTKFFNLSPDQVTRLKTLTENKTLQRILYGPEATPTVRNVELTLDDRDNILVVTDSQENINKVEAFLKEMQLASPPGLVYKSWKIKPEEGQKIKALVEAIVKVQSDAPYDLERKVVVDADDLIVKDTAENVAKIEELLLDKNFIRKLETQKLDVATYNLTPREPIQENIEQVRDFAQNVVTVVKTILYSQSTESAAASEGRRYWYDPNTLQLTVTDFPENLRVVSDYIRSLPALGRRQKSEIVFLKHQTASELSELLQRVLGLTEGPAGGAQAGGESVSRTLRVEGELTFRDMRIRITRINENDVNDENDDSVEMVIRTPTNSEDRTIEEFRSEFVDQYEINVIEVRPSGNNEGSARIEVRMAATATGVAGGFGVPGAVGVGVPGTGVGLGVPGVGIGGVGVPGALGVGVPISGQELAQAGGLVELGIQVETVENMNALLIRYEDPGDLAEVTSWIEQLDIPVLQVNIETKLVEVNENRAKEFMPEFDIGNFGPGRGPDFGQGRGDARFAKFDDEFRDPFDPFPEFPSHAGLLKGTTVIDYLIPGSTGINFQLRTLESEGVINIVNGPHVVVENGQSADFEIERIFGGGTADQGGTGDNLGGDRLQQVQMSVTPQITQLGEIRLDIQDLELQDFGDQITDGLATIDINANDASDNFEPRGYPADFSTVARNFFDIRRRSLQTVARVHNGGTIVLGGWSQEHSRNNDSGVPILRNIPYIGKLFFGRTSDRIDRTTLLIFLTCNLIDP